MTTPDKSHIGKRVKWTSRLGESGYGKLMAVDCDTTKSPHLVQREDGKGWGMDNKFWISSYELIDEPMTLETLVSGTLLKNELSGFQTVLAALGGEGELKTYVMSKSSSDKMSDDLKSFGCTYTAFDLKGYGYTIVDDSQEVVVTMEEIAKLKGVDVSQIRVKE